MTSINAFTKLSKCKKSLSLYTNNSSRITFVQGSCKGRCMNTSSTSTPMRSNSLRPFHATYNIIQNGNQCKLPSFKRYSTFSRNKIPLPTTESTLFIPKNPKTKASSSSSSSFSSSSSSSNNTKKDSILVTTIPKNNNNGRINLIPLIPESTLQTIRTLPEVEQVLSTLHDVQDETTNTNTNTPPPISSTILLDGLERASQIFQHVGKTEYESILLLKATLLSQHCNYDQAIQILTTLLPSPPPLSSNKNLKEMQYSHYDFIIMSNLTKMHWYNGSFDKGFEYATIMNDIAPTLTTSLSSHQSDLDLSPFQVYLHQGCSMNTKALCTLLSSSNSTTSLNATKKVYDVDILQIQNEKDDNNNNNNNASNYDPSILQEMNDVHTTIQMASQILLNAFHQSKNNDTTTTTTATLEQQRRLKIQLGLASASSFCNLGIIDLLDVMIRNQGLNHIPIDSAMNSWRQGISIIDELIQNGHDDDLDVHHEYLAKGLKAKMYCNMAWTILNVSKYGGSSNSNSISGEGGQEQQSLKEDDLKIASEYSSYALKLYDEIIEIGVKHNLGDHESLKPIMGRALGLVATCYAKAGSAVTAEGLLQSAIDLYKIEEEEDAAAAGNEGQSLQFTCPLNQLDARSIYVTYASLCKNWEKREADAKKNAEIALKINEKNFVDGWKGVSGIYSGLSFFAVTDF